MFSYIIWLLILIIWVFHSQLFGYFWYENLLVSWNYEYTKVTLFNIFIPIIFILFLLKNYIFKEKIEINNNYINLLLIIYIMIWISTFFSFIPNVSIFWWLDKSHWLFFINNLFLFFIIIFHIFSKNKWKLLLHFLVFTTVILTVIGIKELYLPSYNYWDLWNRLISTLWHPNYISALYVMIIPYTVSLLKNYRWYKKYFIFIITVLFLLGLMLTKSYIAIFLVFSYLIYEILWKNNKFLYSLFIIFSLFIWSILIFNYFPEKLNSLISRFYIWETTLKIIFSDIKIFFFWIWAENLKFLFDNFKSTELYLYENIWFNADRPHNIFLNIWIHYWVFLLLFALAWFYKLTINIFKNNNWYSTSLLLVIIFWCFNFPNLIGYVFFIMILSHYLVKNYTLNLINKIKPHSYYTRNLFILFLLIISILWWYHSTQAYLSQTYIKKDNYTQAINTFPYYWEYHFNLLDFQSWLTVDNYFKTEKYYLYKIYFSFEKIPECNNLVQHYWIVENYLYCWELIENKFGFEKAKPFYQKAIAKMPDIWNNNSEYLQNKYSNKVINPDRILHPKFSNITEVLEKLNIK
mgnify:CR=1 FL=1